MLPVIQHNLFVYDFFVALLIFRIHRARRKKHIFRARALRCRSLHRLWNVDGNKRTQKEMKKMIRDKSYKFTINYETL